MEKNRIHVFIVVCILVLPVFLAAQFKQEELDRREEWEEFIKAAEITDQYQMSVEEGVTEPWVLTLVKDGITRRGVWKDVEGRLKGYLEGWKYEIAAYRLDKYLGLNMVPPTVEKRFKGNRGACQLFIDTKMDLLEKTNNKIKVPSRFLFEYNRAVYLHRAFDNLIANEDRHMKNFRITEDWRVILIDHSRSFRTSKKFTKNLVYTAKHKQGPKEMKQLPGAFVEKIKSLSFDVIKEIAGEYLKEKEIRAVLVRRDLMLKEIDNLIKKYGEDRVLY